MTGIGKSQSTRAASYEQANHDRASSTSKGRLGNHAITLKSGDKEVESVGLRALKYLKVNYAS